MLRSVLSSELISKRTGYFIWSDLLNGATLEALGPSQLIPIISKPFSLYFS